MNLKTIALSMAMAVMLLPLTANAQHDENQFGLREWGTINAQYDGNKFGLQEWAWLFCNWTPSLRDSSQQPCHASEDMSGVGEIRIFDATR